MTKQLKLCKMKKVKFFELDGENKLTAISQMFNFYNKNKYPNSVIWESEQNIIDELEQDYKPDENFSFYLNEFDEVETKIG